MWNKVICFSCHENFAVFDILNTEYTCHTGFVLIQNENVFFLLLVEMKSIQRPSYQWHLKEQEETLHYAGS